MQLLIRWMHLSHLSTSNQKHDLGGLTAVEAKNEKIYQYRSVSKTWQVLPDLVKFMDNVHQKMMSIHKMNGQLEIEAGQLPASKEFFICMYCTYMTYTKTYYNHISDQTDYIHIDWQSQSPLVPKKMFFFVDLSFSLAQVDCRFDPNHGSAYRELQVAGRTQGRDLFDG